MLRVRYHLLWYWDRCMINKRYKSWLVCSYSCFSYLIFLTKSRSYELSYVCITVLVWSRRVSIENATLIKAIEREPQWVKFFYHQHMIKRMCEKTGECHMFCCLCQISTWPSRCVKKPLGNIHMHWNMFLLGARTKKCAKELF